MLTASRQPALDLRNEAPRYPSVYLQIGPSLLVPDGFATVQEVADALGDESAIGHLDVTHYLIRHATGHRM